METHIKTYSPNQLSVLMKELGESPFRARQLEEWLYVHHVDSYDKMTNLPKALRSTLSEIYPLYTPSIINKRISKDGTRKYIIEFHDNTCVETVAIPSKNDSRLTVCFSTQIGCPMACDFCATGKESFIRNLFPGEIVDQVLLAQEDMGKRVTNIVGMGQGEPFLNYDNVLAALRILNNPKGIALGARHISLSTCGVLSGIQRLASEPEQFTLAVSLHSAVQETRDYLMPKVACFPLPDLRKELQSYIRATKRRVTFEYIMIRNVNDQPSDLQALLRFCKGLLCHINLIPINSIKDSPYQPSSAAVIKKWVSEITNSGIEVTIRDSRGSDIAGACGQLKQTHLL
ncbi:23S rRNA (adenine(2503)-C(2))-methyltransferase RlmN [Adlercreutzia sp. ZJ141]|uniref:23S rRNA (adenine(2503)-C(2))-methyltransferase RlmN n=1 Tax=Adlercreutzia sp. ZJ141 TaxID=2709406 RepID=UPI0013ED99E9|nr:23S rRNA (adenine(2503)-C(2))-methyltransferase RlmN [Adlercreutzia sp. ZJ141]